MLEKLFGSKTRAKIISLIFSHPEKKYYLQEVVQATKADPANVVRELKKLTQLGILSDHKEKKRSLYSANTHSPLFSGLQLLTTPQNDISFLPTTQKLTSETRARITNKQWYHQRFDGSPLFLLSIAEAELRREQRKPNGTEASMRVSFFHNGAGDWYIPQEDIQAGSQVVLEIGRTNPHISSEFLTAWQDDEQRFADYFQNTFPKLQLHNISTEKLRRAWSEYYELGLKRFTSSSVIDHFALGTDEHTQQLLRQEVYSQPRGKKLSGSEFTQLFAIATAPVRQSFINQAEIDLLRIANGESTISLEQHQQKYFWINNNYNDAYVLTVQHFKQIVDTWKKSNKDLKKEQQKLQQTPSDNAEKKRCLFEQYTLSDELKTLIRISEDFSWWQDERKKATYLNIHMGICFLQEIGKRFGYTARELQYTSSAEIQSLFDGSGPTHIELAARQQQCVFIATREGICIQSGTHKTESIRATMFGNKTTEQAQDVRGLSASLGRAIGTVKVVQSVKEIGKVQTGDILVAVMTRPDYAPAMRKAAAIITNEGGITSHAAIVSREIGIPCIIGTRIATEIFHDGDVVEVNANHGWARKIQA